MIGLLRLMVRFKRMEKACSWPPLYKHVEGLNRYKLKILECTLFVVVDLSAKESEREIAKKR